GRGDPRHERRDRELSRALPHGAHGPTPRVRWTPGGGLSRAVAGRDRADARGRHQAGQIDRSDDRPEAAPGRAVLRGTKRRVTRPGGQPSHGAEADDPALVTDLLLRGCVLPGRPRLVDISIANGRITELLTHEPGVRAPANERIDVGGRVVTPGLVEAHIHLDKALLSERLATGAESALDAIRMVAEAKRGFTADDFHIDFFDEPAHMHIRKVIDRTHRTGWRGRVAVGHLSEASALPAVEQKELAEDLAKAGIGVISLPATDLYLMGRNDDINPP